ncbi:MAG: DUF3616 domain-containing protein, partial [Shimia sp.]
MTDTKKSPRTVKLTFEDKEAFVNVDDPIHKDLSAAARHDEALFFSCDETAGVDRLLPDGKDWGHHEHFNLGEYVDLPVGPDGEMDIEGLDIDGDWLWVLGSHSYTRDKPDDDEGPAEALATMAEIERDPNRTFLGRFPLNTADGAPRPVAHNGERRCAIVDPSKKGGLLRKWLSDDAHLAPFLDLPSKENGLDLEGIAAKGLRVWIGCRGPVLRAHAVLLEMEMKVTKDGWLKPRKIDEGRRYRKYLVDTKGMGVRDLKFDGDDLLILTGTTMAGDSPSEILRWRQAVAVTTSQVVPPAHVEQVRALPYRGPEDHPEGLVQMADGTWLVVYDNPAQKRLGEGPASVTGDLFAL